MATRLAHAAGGGVVLSASEWGARGGDLRRRGALWVLLWWAGTEAPEFAGAGAGLSRRRLAGVHRLGELAGPGLEQPWRPWLGYAAG